MPKSTILEIPPEEQAQMLAALRRERYGYLLALHILLWCALGRHPTEMADALFCSRSRVYRTVRAYRAGTLGLEPDEDGRLSRPLCTTVLVPMVRRSLLALLKASPRAYGWCRTRWSCATLALTWPTKRGVTASAETMRRWVHEVGWVWKRATRVAKDDDPQRVSRPAHIRYRFEPLRRGPGSILLKAKAFGLFTRRDPMDHDVIVEQWLDRCKRVIENILQAPDLHSVASTSLAIFAQLRHVSRDILQARTALEAQQRGGGRLRDAGGGGGSTMRGPRSGAADAAGGGGSGVARWHDVEWVRLPAHLASRRRVSGADRGAPPTTPPAHWGTAGTGLRGTSGPDRPGAIRLSGGHPHTCARGWRCSRDYPRPLGVSREARQSLAQVYGRVGEGFATADLREARALLDELASQPSPGFGKALPVTTA